MVTARAGPVLEKAFETTCAISTQSGVPGGCGIPKVRAAVTSSDASQNVRSGAAVARYAEQSTTIVSTGAMTDRGICTRARGVGDVIPRI